MPTVIEPLPWPWRHRGLVLAVAVTAAASGAYALLARPAPPPPATLVVPMPAVVPVTTAVAAPVTVNLPPRPTPAPPPPPEEPPAPAPRVLRPMIDSGCGLLPDDVEPDGPCMWETGLPAISADGSTVVFDEDLGDGGRGYPNHYVTFIDAASSLITKRQPIVTADEYVPSEEQAAWTKLQAKVAARLASAQRMLDAGRYRSLVRLGGTDDVERSVAAGHRVEVQGNAARVVDVETNAVIWQEWFPVQRAYPARPLTDDDEGSCYPSHTRAIDVWWDPETRSVIARVAYASGPCYCDDVVHTYVRRAAAVD